MKKRKTEANNLMPNVIYITHCKERFVSAVFIT